MLIGDQIEVEFEIGNRYFEDPEAISYGHAGPHICTPFVRIKSPILRHLISKFVSEVEYKTCSCTNHFCKNTSRYKIPPENEQNEISLQPLSCIKTFDITI